MTFDYRTLADCYIRNMAQQPPLMRLAARLFYSQAKYLAKNKILCVLTSSSG